MLNKEIIDKIIDFVRKRPRTIQEIAVLLQKNWRTADRYVGTIITETGLIETRTFREGTRGALKIVFWNALEQMQGSAYQERLLQRILHGTHKEDFSPFDIYQFIPTNARKAFIEHTEYSKNPKIRYDSLLASAKNQVLFFSGNLSWTEQPNAIKKIEEIAIKKVSIKILTRVDVVSQQSTIALLKLNHRVGWDAVQIRHCEQPLRAMMIDDALASIKEVLSPQHHRELEKKTFIFYLIEDTEWISWLQKVFWLLWGQSVDATIRIEALQTIRKFVV